MIFETLHNVLKLIDAPQVQAATTENLNYKGQL